ncbi:MAG: hypothetical protein ACJARD_000652 [Alphaproteobacteria bacterium]|jgi:hypothetical protein
MGRKKKVDLELEAANKIEPELIEPEVNDNETNAEEVLVTQDAIQENTQSHSEYLLQNEMTLDEIQDFIDDIIKALSGVDIIYINLEKCEVITTPVIQAIISLNRYAQDQEKAIKWQNPTAAFSDAFNNLGFYSEMMKLEFAA